MEVTYVLTEEDYIAFNINHIENSPSQKKVFLLVRYLLPFVCAVVAYLVGTRVFNQPEVFWLFFSFLLMVGLWFYYPKVYEDSIRKQAIRLLNEGDNSSLFGEKKLMIGQDFIQMIGADASESIIYRKNIKEIKEYTNQIILYLSAVQGIIIPTKNLDQNSLIELREALDFFKN